MQRHSSKSANYPSSSAAASYKKGKKGKKGQKVDPFLLGFSVHAAERPNIGEIQTINDTRK